MIGFSSKDCHRPIKLFYKKQAYHLMGKSHLAQRYLSISTLINTLGKSIRATNYKDNFLINFSKIWS